MSLQAKIKNKIKKIGLAALIALAPFVAKAGPLVDRFDEPIYLSSSKSLPKTKDFVNETGIYFINVKVSLALEGFIPEISSV